MEINNGLCRNYLLPVLYPSNTKAKSSISLSICFAIIEKRREKIVVFSVKSSVKVTYTVMYMRTDYLALYILNHSTTTINDLHIIIFCKKKKRSLIRHDIKMKRDSN